jgi:hypothetical protein
MSALFNGRLVAQCNCVLDENLVFNTRNVQGHFGDGVLGWCVSTTDAVVSLLDSDPDLSINHVRQCGFMACPQKWQRQHIHDIVALIGSKVLMHLWRDNALEETVADVAVILQFLPHWTANFKDARKLGICWKLLYTNVAIDDHSILVLFPAPLDLHLRIWAAILSTPSGWEFAVDVWSQGPFYFGNQFNRIWLNPALAEYMTVPLIGAIWFELVVPVTKQIATMPVCCQPALQTTGKGEQDIKVGVGVGGSNQQLILTIALLHDILAPRHFSLEREFTKVVMGSEVIRLKVRDITSSSDDMELELEHLPSLGLEDAHRFDEGRPCSRHSIFCTVVTVSFTGTYLEGLPELERTSQEIWLLGMK